MFGKLSFGQVKTEILCGLTVALALVPEAVAFAFVAGVNPIVALYAAFFIGLITAVFGGRPGMISGATGALAVVMTSLVTAHGVEYLFATVILMGMIQIVIGLMGLGKVVQNIVPHPVMLGFVNGLAIVIFLSQLGHFQVTSAEGVSEWMGGSDLATMLGLILVTMGIVHFLPKFSKAIPSPLVAIFVLLGLTSLFGIETVTVGDMATISGGLPQFHIPMVPFTTETLQIIFPYSLILAGIGLVESLLTLTLVDEITETEGSSTRECLAQGAANILTGLFGGMGGCAMIGQSMINISAGARHRLAGASAALFLLASILFAGPFIERIPLAALIGVMVMVSIATFAWSSFGLMNKIPRADAIVIVAVSGLTVMFDLAIAVLTGVIVSALVYAWKSATHISATEEERREAGEKIYHLHGTLFFAAVSEFRSLFNVKEDPDLVVINFTHCMVLDHSALEALMRLSLRYSEQGKELRFENLSENCNKLLTRMGIPVTEKEAI